MRFERLTTPAAAAVDIITRNNNKIQPQHNTTTSNQSITKLAHTNEW